MSQEAFRYLVWLAMHWQSKEYWLNLRITRIDLKDQLSKLHDVNGGHGYEGLTFKIDDIAWDDGDRGESLPTYKARELAVVRFNQLINGPHGFGRALQLYAHIRLAMMKLGDLEDYVRKYIPTSLKNIPIVDLLGDQDLDMDQVVKNMRAVECDARSRAMELKYDVGVDSDMLVGDVRVILAGDEADGKVSRPSTLDQQRFEFYEQCKAAYSRATYAQVSVKWNQLKNGDECNESTLKQSVYRVREAKKTRNGA